MASNPKLILDWLPIVPNYRGTGSSSSCTFRFVTAMNSGETESEIHPESSNARASVPFMVTKVANH